MLKYWWHKWKSFKTCSCAKDRYCWCKLRKCRRPLLWLIRAIWTRSWRDISTGTTGSRRAWTSRHLPPNHRHRLPWLRWKLLHPTLLLLIRQKRKRSASAKRTRFIVSWLTSEDNCVEGCVCVQNLGWVCEWTPCDGHRTVKPCMFLDDLACF